MVDLWLNTGMRPQEIYALAWDNVDLQQRAVTVSEACTNPSTVKETKGRTKRRLRVSERLLGALQGHESQRPIKVEFTPTLGTHRTVIRHFVFPSKGSKMRPMVDGPYFRDNVWKPVVRAIGKPDLVPYDLRHTFASRAIQAGADIKALQGWLGHSSATLTLDTYGHLFPDRLDELADRIEETWEEA